MFVEQDLTSTGTGRHAPTFSGFYKIAVFTVVETLRPIVKKLKKDDRPLFLFTLYSRDNRSQREKSLENNVKVHQNVNRKIKIIVHSFPNSISNPIDIIPKREAGHK